MRAVILCADSLKPEAIGRAVVAAGLEPLEIDELLAASHGPAVRWARREGIDVRWIELDGVVFGSEIVYVRAQCLADEADVALVIGSDRSEDVQELAAAMQLRRKPVYYGKG